MTSRFTEHFEFNESLEDGYPTVLCSPLSTSSECYFSSSTETLGYQVASLSEEEYSNNNHNNRNSIMLDYNSSNSSVSLSSKNPSLMHTHSITSAISNDETVTSTSKIQIKSKLKRLLNTIGNQYGRKSSK